MVPKPYTTEQRKQLVSDLDTLLEQTSTHIKDAGLDKRNIEGVDPRSYETLQGDLKRHYGRLGIDRDLAESVLKDHYSAYLRLSNKLASDNVFKRNEKIDSESVNRAKVMIRELKDMLDDSTKDL